MLEASRYLENIVPSVNLEIGFGSPLHQHLYLFVSHSQARSTRSSLDYAVIIQLASGIEADINQGLFWEKMKLQNHFTGSARLQGTSHLLNCWTFHAIIQSMIAII